MSQQQNNDMKMETEICHNCKREVPQQNYLMHVAHCARNMTVCPVCGDAVPKAHLKEHRQKEHALVTCPACRNKLQAGAMENHRATSCGQRTVACEYCELELPKDDLSEHEKYCGARTERCNDCGELVMHKYKKLHLNSNHGFLKLNDEPGPTPSWEMSTTANRAKRNGMNRSPHTASTANNTSLNSMRSLSNALESASNTETAPVVEEVSLKSKKLDEENGYLPVSDAPPRDTPRTFVPAYDASEDLRAKVKLARHDLNNIKNTYLLQGEERVRQQHGRQNVPPPRGPELLATNRTPRTRFTTNLVPYEKNKSVRVNALPDEERAVAAGTVPQPLPILTPLGGTAAVRGGGYFNYLGAREDGATAPALPVLLPLTKKIKNGSAPSSGITSILKTSPPTTNINSNGNGTGAVPRSSRKKGPAPPVPNSSTKQRASVDAGGASTPPDRNEVTLPCEFCDDMVFASHLVQHETACRPDLAQLRVPNNSEDCSIGASAAAPTVALPTSPEVELPCEFCCLLYPASKLLSHQALCGV